MDYNGCISLEIGKKSDGRRESYIEKQFYKLPLQVLTPFYQDADGTVFVYLLNPSGGILDYDCFSVDVRVKSGASAWLGTPSAGRIYKKRLETATQAYQKSVFYVESGAALEYCPEEIMPYANSAFMQENIFHLRKDSTLIAWDILSAGRTGRGECFAFDRYASKTFIYVEDCPLVIDKMVVCPDKTDVRNLQCMQDYLYTATVYAYADACDEELKNQLTAEGAHYTDGIMGASIVTDRMLVIKILGMHAYAVYDELQSVWDILRRRILDKPAVRLRKF